MNMDGTDTRSSGKKRSKLTNSKLIGVAEFTICRSRRYGTTRWEATHRYLLKAISNSDGEGTDTIFCRVDLRSYFLQGKELEKLTGAYVAIYTARYITQFLNDIYRELEHRQRFYRPESVENKKHRLFISDNLQNADSILAERISGALNDIN